MEEIRVAGAMVNINGEKIRDLRESKGLTQLYVATYIGVTTDTVSRWENQHYQSIKKENAVKLAESLDVSLHEILESGSTDGIEKSVFPLPIEKIKQHWVILSLMLSVIVLFAWLWRGGQAGPGVTVHRRMPSHVPPGSIFPVTIRIDNDSEKAVSLIITEILPRGINATKGEPSFQSMDSKKGVVKWIVNSNEKILYFSYLAVMAEGVQMGEGYNFSGTVLVRQGERVPLAAKGDSLIKITRFHWADTNMDNRVDDKEILTVFDRFNAFKGLDSTRSRVEDIWAGSGYQWNKEKKEYVITP